MIDTTITIADHGTPLTIDFADCVKYHGRTSIGGVALGFRLIQHALRDMAGGATVERETISVRTAFPGLGVRDAVEMLTRASTRNAYHVDLAAAPASAPDAVAGRLWFEVSIGNQTRAYCPPHGAMGEEFIAIGRLSKQRSLTDAEVARWTELKEALAALLMSLSPEQCILPA